ncbi:MAG: flagellar biosynthesis anti-sigma factor FlgM [Phycisphaerales bacterium]|nr:flagellar biosynthesis anti-sigma factor FlgM [Phycisphaerales bacterium]
MTDISQTGPVSSGRIPAWGSTVRPDGRGQQVITHEATSAATRADSVELSSLARQLDAADHPDIRTDLVNNVRALIAKGEYITDDRLNATVDAIIDQYG